MPSITLSNVTYDFGSVVDRFLAPLMAEINQVLAPIRPALDVLNTAQPQIAETATLNFGTGNFDITTLRLAVVGFAERAVTGNLRGDERVVPRAAVCARHQHQGGFLLPGTRVRVRILGKIHIHFVGISRWRAGAPSNGRSNTTRRWRRS